jgi:hypothetical protein
MELLESAARAVVPISADLPRFANARLAVAPNDFSVRLALFNSRVNFADRTLRLTSKLDIVAILVSSYTPVVHNVVFCIRNIRR